MRTSSVVVAAVSMVLVVSMVGLGSACRTLPKTPQAALDALGASPGGYLTGTPAALGPAEVLNREDFVYDARLSSDGASAAVSRLGIKSFFLSLFSLSVRPAVRRADVAINPLEFDVESIEFFPDGKAVVAVSKDKAVRVFSAADGKLLSSWLTEEPLVSVAVHPTGHLLAVGSTKGLVSVFSWPGLGYVGEARAHADEVRALTFASDGTLYSGGWDKRIVAWAVREVASVPRTVRTAVEKKAGVQVVRAVLDSAAVASFALDARFPAVMVKPALAQAVGIDANALTENATVQTSFGSQVVRLARGRRLAIKGLVFEAVDVAVCEACVPPDLQGVLGQNILEQVEYATDQTRGELVVTAREGARVTSAANMVMDSQRTFTFEAYVNDFSVDARGRVLGVAFSEAKAERTREVYEREKRNEVEPHREWDCGALVDAGTGRVMAKLRGHRGVVSTAGVSPDGRALATGGWDKRVRLGALGRALAELQSADQPASAFRCNPEAFPEWPTATAREKKALLARCRPELAESHEAAPDAEERFGWAVRRVRFSRDGRSLIVAAWTPQNPLNDHQSDPAAVVYEVLYREATVVTPGTP